MKNLDVDLLRTFIAVVDNGSFTRAASQIHRSQSAISMQVKRLESQLSQVLFQRNGRNITLTQEGKSLVSYARRLLNLHDEAIEQLVNRPQEKLFRIGCPDDYTVVLLPSLIKKLREINPEIHVRVLTANSGVLRQAMDNGEIDLAILTRASNSNEGSLIYQEQGVWVCQNRESLMQRPLPIVLFEPSCKFHSKVIDSLEKADIDYDLICDASHINLLVDMIRKRNVVSVLPELAVPDDLISAELAQITDLPVAEVILCASGGQQVVAGYAIQELAQYLSKAINNLRTQNSIKPLNNTAKARLEIA